MPAPPTLVTGATGFVGSAVARTLLAHLRSGSRVVGGSVHVAGDDVFALDDRARRALRGGTAALVAQNAGQALTPSMRVGRQLREAFVAEPGNVLLAADYSQIELRLAAHMADVPELKEAYATGQDIHALTAEQLYGTVDRDTRGRAKTINFAILYGISRWGLAGRLEISADEAQALEFANDTPYGLSSSVFTADHSRAIRMSRALDFGCVWINTHIPLIAEMPHGGFKESGYGKDLSAYSLEDYTVVKHVMASLS